MAKSKDLIQQVEREIEASKTISPTAAGPTEPPSDEQIDTINQVFALFRLNYHNQFYAAYPDSEQLNQVKKLWLEALRLFPVEQILRGAKHAIETSDYLPTLNRMLESCRDELSAYGLPDTASAYREACAARSPKSAQHWSHPAVYHAGCEAGWFFLSSEPESRTRPAFEQAYRRFCARVMAGDELRIEAPAALPASSGIRSSPGEALEELAKIRDSLRE
jgi:hypothetical protein